MELREGEIHAIIGPNGAGKTTLFNVLSGETPADQRLAFPAGAQCDGLGGGSPGARRPCSQLPAFLDIRKSQHIRERPARRASAAARSSMRFFKPAARYSRSMRAREKFWPTWACCVLRDACRRDQPWRQRQLEIAMLIAIAPKLMLLDEPTSGMGKSETRELMDILRRLPKPHPRAGRARHGRGVHPGEADHRNGQRRSNGDRHARGGAPQPQCPLGLSWRARVKHWWQIERGLANWLQSLPRLRGRVAAEGGRVGDRGGTSRSRPVPRRYATAAFPPKERCANPRPVSLRSTTLPRKRGRDGARSFVQMVTILCGRIRRGRRGVSAVSNKWVGQSIARFEDAALLTGNARFIDDLEPVAGLRHAAILRSPHAHADIVGLDTSEAERLPGVIGVLTGQDVAAMAKPIGNLITRKLQLLSLRGRTRALFRRAGRGRGGDRSLYRRGCARPDRGELSPACRRWSIPRRRSHLTPPVLHEELGTNVVHARSFTTAIPKGISARRTSRVGQGCVSARQFDADRNLWRDCRLRCRQRALHRLVEFPGTICAAPRSCATRLACAATSCGSCSRRRAGGSFGIKQGVYPYIVLIGLASRKFGCPVKWIEDRIEHLAASSASSGRVTTMEGAFAADGALLALRLQAGRECRRLSAPARSGGALPHAFDLERSLSRAQSRDR